MRLDELDFEIPKDLIAQRPAKPRDACRLMHLTADGARRHAVFSDLPDILDPEDTLVFNDSRVLPARVIARKPSGAKVELLFLRETGGECGGNAQCWEALARPSQRLRVGGELVVGDGKRLFLKDYLGVGRWVIEGPPGRCMVEMMEKLGRLPLPPYIETYPDDPSSYQTVYAVEPGSAAAPTAGLHFTPELIRRLERIGVGSAYVTLHVGLDTFQPIRESIVEDHRIHSETYFVSAKALQAIRRARESGGRLIAVGTTAARVLETLAIKGAFAGPSKMRPARSSTNLFITPGHRFQAVDALLTNFHLPRSSVLALTMAFAGVKRLREAYVEAIAQGYRFFSFGDAMLIDKSDAPPSESEQAAAQRSVTGGSRADG